MASALPIIHRDPDILGGVAIFFGTRVPVKTLLDYLEAGDSLNEFLDLVACWIQLLQEK